MKGSLSANFISEQNRLQGDLNEKNVTDVFLAGLHSTIEAHGKEEGLCPPPLLRHLPAINPRSRWQNDAGLRAFELGFDLPQRDSRCTARRSR